MHIRTMWSEEYLYIIYSGPKEREKQTTIVDAQEKIARGRKEGEEG